VLGATVVVAAAPWLYYSGGTAFTPYAPPRYIQPTVIFDEYSPASFLESDGFDPMAVEATGVFSPAGMWRQLTADPGRVPEATVQAVVGRNVGLVVWAPVVMAAMAAGLWRWRRQDAMGRALVVALVGYLVLYVVLYPGNFFGGAHSLGNRYLIQASPLALGVIACLGWRVRTAVTVGLVALGWSVVALWPHHADPSEAYLRIDRTSAVQELFPAGPDRGPYAEFRCALAYGFDTGCTPPPANR